MAFCQPPATSDQAGVSVARSRGARSLIEAVLLSSAASPQMKFEATAAAAEREAANERVGLSGKPSPGHAVDGPTGGSRRGQPDGFHPETLTPLLLLVIRRP